MEDKKMENKKTEDKKISIKKMIEDFKIDVVYMPDEKDYMISTTDINRPGIQLSGYYDHFPFERIQVIGKVEYTYYLSLDEDLRKQRIEKYMSYDIPVLILARDQQCDETMLEAAVKNERIILKTKVGTTKFIYKLLDYLNEQLAAETTVHGVLVDVDGIGILLTGDSGVGKSETALELIKRSHRLVADDAVEIKKLDDDVIVGKAPEIIKHFMEVRGLGILDIKSLYGVGAVKPSKKIDMVVHLEYWEDGKYYERLGIDDVITYILDVPVEKITIPVKPGRNLAVIIEIAARNHRQKRMGYNAAKTFNENLMKRLSKEGQV